MTRFRCAGEWTDQDGFIHPFEVEVEATGKLAAGAEAMDAVKARHAPDVQTIRVLTAEPLSGGRT